MKNEQFDELQIRNRQKIAYQTMFLTLVEIVMNGIIKDVFIANWATPMLEAIILIGIPILYFISMCIWKNAYFTDEGVKPNIIMVIFLVIGIRGIVFAIPDDNRYIYNGVLDFDPMGISGIFLVAISVQYWIKGLIDRIKNKNDE